MRRFPIARVPRRWLVSGAAAGAIVVAGGSLLIANGKSESRPGETTGAAQLQSVPRTTGPDWATVTEGPLRPSRGAPYVSLPAMHPITALPQKADERLDAAKKAGAHDIKPQHPVIRAEGAGLDVKVSENGDVRKGGKMLRVVSAHGDLTGYNELAWVADAGRPFGDADCSQNFRLSNEQVPKVRPTLMVCWRTSAKRSAYTVSVDLKGHPSKTEAVGAIDKAWKSLG
jgi:hypothetical protein